MKVEQLNSQHINWTKPQVVVSANGRKVQICTNIKPDNRHCFSGMDLETGELSTNWDIIMFKPETPTDYPIELKLTIETPEELCDLWHRINLDPNNVIKNSNDDLLHGAKYDESFFNKLDKLVKERNIYKND